MKSSDLSRRLKEAREKAGYKSATDAARKMGINVVTYTAHENGGREYDRDAAVFYAQNFGVTPGWLMFGDDTNGRRSEQKHSLDSRSVNARNRTISPASRQSWMETTSSIADMEEYWEMPEQFLQVRLNIPRDRARILEVQGDSMYDPDNPAARGSLLPGERVIIDTEDIRPTPAGAFAIHDGAGVTIKMVEVIPNSDPITLRLTGRNPRYDKYELAAHDVKIVGRVKAKVTAI